MTNNHTTAISIIIIIMIMITIVKVLIFFRGWLKNNTVPLSVYPIGPIMITLYFFSFCL